MHGNPSLHRSTTWLRLLRYVTGLAAGAALLLATSTPAPASEDVPGPLAQLVHQALDEWSQFATTGDLDALGASFAMNGPQWGQFETESVAWGGAAGAEPFRLGVHELRLRRLHSTTATVWAKVEAARVGFSPQVFAWDFDLIFSDGRWQVWTVVTADQPPIPADMPATAPPTVTESTTTTAPTALATQREPSAMDGGISVAGAEPSTGIKLPVLSAWVVVITVVGVAAAGYMAPRMERRRER